MPQSGGARTERTGCGGDGCRQRHRLGRRRGLRRPRHACRHGRSRRARAVLPRLALLQGDGADVQPVVVDVRDPESVEGAGRVVIERFGALHVAVNNAGVVGGGTSWEIPLEEWRRVIDVDLWGVIHGVRTFVPLILASGAEGHVVNVASMAAVSALPRLAPYTVAKHGVLGLTDVLAGRARGPRCAGGRQRRDARDGQDGHEPDRDRRAVDGGGKRPRRPSSTRDRTCSPTTTAPTRWSGACVPSSPRAPT